MNSSQALTAFQTIADRLRADTRSDRTTIRVDCEALSLEIESVAAESLAEGVRAIKAVRSEGLREGAAPRWITRHRRTFVMDDCLAPWDPDLAPEPYVIEVYGVRSEMVSPVLRGETLGGVVSVHHTRGPRHWLTHEIARIESACREVGAVLSGIDG